MTHQAEKKETPTHTAAHQGKSKSESKERKPEMSAQKKSVADPFTLAPGQMMAQLSALNANYMTAMVKTNSAIMKGWADVTQEVARFTANSLDNGLKTAEELAKCRDASQLWEVQRSSAQKVTEQYMDEARALHDMTAQVTDEICSSAQLQAQSILQTPPPSSAVQH